jgi:2-polyprenyl-3-methyl-5-hydroxy-6-metoxy-1,4-benzoquinol methylase
MQRKAIVIGVVDNDIISRSLSRYLFVAQFVRGLVLDVGCGSSYGISIINRVAKGLNDVVGLDIDIDLLRYGKSLYNVDGLILADARFLPFKQQTFDSIICLELIEHLPKIGQIKLCQDLYNALKKMVSYSFPHPINSGFLPSTNL